MKKYGLILLLSVLLTASARAQSLQSLRDSLKAATEVLSFHPDSIDLRLRKAAWNLLLGQWQYAQDEYDYVLRRQPTNVSGLYYRAFTNEKLGRLKFARMDYEALLQIVPGHFESQLGLALLNQKDKHYTEAYDQINRLVSQFPDSAVAYAARAGIERERGMRELAAYDYGEAIRRDPTCTDYLLSHADLCIGLGRSREARLDLDMMVRLGVPRASLRPYYRRLK